LSQADTPYRRYLLTVLAIVYAFQFMDQAVLSLLLQPIKEDLHLSDTQMGFLTGIAFALFYATFGIPIARWADRGNRITIISLAIALWSSMLVFCGMAASFWQLLIARICAAVGESGSSPPAQSLIGEYYSRSERPAAMAYYMMGGNLSVLIGSAVCGWLNVWYGWRVAFFAIAVPGLVIAVVVRLTLHEPRIKRVREQPSEWQPPAGLGYRAVFARLWKQESYRNLLIGYTLIQLISYGIAQWAPTFLMRTHHISTGEVGTWQGVIWGVGGAIGTFGGGYLARRYTTNKERLQLKVMAAAMLAFMPLYLGIYLSPNKYLAFSLMATSALLYCSIFGPLFAMIQEIVAPQMRAMAVAILLLFAQLVGQGLGPMAVGIMSDLLRPEFGDGSLRIALLVWTPGYILAAIHLIRAGKHVESDVAVSRGSVGA
jgi:MFS family permease